MRVHDEEWHTFISKQCKTPVEMFRTIERLLDTASSLIVWYYIRLIHKSRKDFEKRADRIVEMLRTNLLDTYDIAMKEEL